MTTIMPATVGRHHHVPARNPRAAAPLVLAAAILTTGCVTTASLVRPADQTLETRLDDPSGSTSRAHPPRAKADSAVLRAQSGPAELTQPPRVVPVEPVAVESAIPPNASQPSAPSVVDVSSPFVLEPIEDQDGVRLYPYDPMRGAVVSPVPPPNPDITLRELLGLGRSDIADEETEAKPRYPRLHDDPLARSPVPPSERSPLLFPSLSNLIFGRDWELTEDADDARDEVLRRRSNYDVRLPGPDTANFPNSAFTLPKGRALIENSPASFIGKSQITVAQYNWPFLLRYGLTDDIEFRIFSGGLTASSSRPPTTGFAPMGFDIKYHMWDENLEKHIPAAAGEIYIVTPFGTPSLSGGTQPSIALLLDHTLPLDVLLEHNFGLTGVPGNVGGAVYEFSYQWALQRQVFKDFAVFTHGFINATALPIVLTPALTLEPPPTSGLRSASGLSRTMISQPEIEHSRMTVVVVGGGFLWNLSKRLAFWGSYNAGLNPNSPQVMGFLGFAIAL
jgi:hypothetical protein